MLEIEIRKKVYRTAGGNPLVAVDGLSVSVADGEFVCLIGPSGCGKTTVLRLVLGLDRDFDGRIKPDTSDRRIGVVFQEPRLLPWRTVEENVRLALPADMRATDLDALFETLGLATMRGFYPGELSLGLARRAAIARAFAIKPALLVLDEPFVSLDEETASRLRKLLTEVWQQRPTMALMVTHDLREAVELADRIVLLTPRPAKLRGVAEIKVPRGERDREKVAQRVAEISAKYPGVA
jgi:NitT/TauT family transport system ATP-binding protein